MAMSKEKLQTRKPKNQGGNLVPITNSEMAKEYQRRSVESRRRNKERLQTLKSFTDDLEKIGVDVGDKAPKGIDVLRFCMVQAIHDEDFDLAAQYAEKIAAFETPKLASQQVDITTRDLSDLSDEEFEAELEKLNQENEDDSED